MPTDDQLSEWERSNAAYPDHLVPVDQEQWPTMDNSPVQTGSVAIGAYRSNAFVVIVWREPSGFVRLSVNRTDWDDGQGRFRDNIGWDDLQRLKAEAGFSDVAAVEIYPPDQHVLNTANIRHLFLLPSSPAFMWERDGANYVKLSEAA